MVQSVFCGSDVFPLQFFNSGIFSRSHTQFEELPSPTAYSSVDTATTCGRAFGGSSDDWQASGWPLAVGAIAFENDEPFATRGMCAHPQ